MYGGSESVRGLEPGNRSPIVQHLEGHDASDAGSGAQIRNAGSFTRNHPVLPDQAFIDALRSTAESARAKSRSPGHLQMVFLKKLQTSKVIAQTTLGTKVNYLLQHPLSATQREFFMIDLANRLDTTANSQEGLRLTSVRRSPVSTLERRQDNSPRQNPPLIDIGDSPPSSPLPRAITPVINLDAALGLTTQDAGSPTEVDAHAHPGPLLDGGMSDAEIERALQTLVHREIIDETFAPFFSNVHLLGTDESQRRPPMHPPFSPRPREPEPVGTASDIDSMARQRRLEFKDLLRRCQPPPYSTGPSANGSAAALAPVRLDAATLALSGTSVSTPRHGTSSSVEPKEQSALCPVNEDFSLATSESVASSSPKVPAPPGAGVAPNKIVQWILDELMQSKQRKSASELLLLVQKEFPNEAPRTTHGLYYHIDAARRLYEAGSSVATRAEVLLSVKRAMQSKQPREKYMVSVSTRLKTLHVNPLVLQGLFDAAKRAMADGATPEQLNSERLQAHTSEQAQSMVEKFFTHPDDYKKKITTADQSTIAANSEGATSAVDHADNVDHADASPSPLQGTMPPVAFDASEKRKEFDSFGEHADGTKRFASMSSPAAEDEPSELNPASTAQSLPDPHDPAQTLEPPATGVPQGPAHFAPPHDGSPYQHVSMATQTTPPPPAGAAPNPLLQPAVPNGDPASAP